MKGTDKRIQVHSFNIFIFFFTLHTFKYQNEKKSKNCPGSESVGNRPTG